MTDPFASFEELAEERRYPGSKRAIPDRRRLPEPAPAADPDRWDAHPRTYLVGGQTVEFFYLGALAKALGKQPVTIRKWEREGVIPKARVRTKAVTPDKKRRLYTRPQIEGMIKIAQEEGILGRKPKRIADTRFTERVLQLFRALEA